MTHKKNITDLSLNNYFKEHAIFQRQGRVATSNSSEFPKFQTKFRWIQWIQVNFKPNSRVEQASLLSFYIILPCGYTIWLENKTFQILWLLRQSPPSNQHYLMEGSIERLKYFHHLKAWIHIQISLNVIWCTNCTQAKRYYIKI